MQTWLDELCVCVCVCLMLCFGRFVQSSVQQILYVLRADCMNVAKNEWWCYQTTPIQKIVRAYFEVLYTRTEKKGAAKITPLSLTSLTQASMEMRILKHGLCFAFFRSLVVSICMHFSRIDKNNNAIYNSLNKYN